jgi:hypothetical protein
MHMRNIIRLLLFVVAAVFAQAVPAQEATTCQALKTDKETLPGTGTTRIVKITTYWRCGGAAIIVTEYKAEYADGFNSWERTECLGNGTDHPDCRTIRGEGAGPAEGTPPYLVITETLREDVQG